MRPAPHLSLIVDATDRFDEVWAAALPEGWELLVMQFQPGLLYGAQLQKALEDTQAPLLMYVPPLVLPQSFGFETLPSACAWVGEAAEPGAAPLWVAWREHVMAVGGCHPLLAGPRQVSLDLLGRLEANAVHLMPLPAAALAWRRPSQPASRWEQALEQARIAADAAGDAAVLVKHPWGPRRRGLPAALLLEQGLERKRRQLRHQAFWMQLLDLPLPLFRSLPAHWCEAEGERGFEVKPWHRRYWRVGRWLTAAADVGLAHLLRLVR